MIERPQPGVPDPAQAPPLAPPPNPTSEPNPAEAPLMPPPRILPGTEAPPTGEPGRPDPFVDPPVPGTTPAGPADDPPA